MAIVGAGYIADFHASALRATPGIEAVAVCDLHAARACELASRHGLPAVYSDIETLIERERPGTAHLLVPAEAHQLVGEQLLEAGVDLLVEKPLGADSGAAASLAALATQQDRRLGVSHNFLFFPAYERLRQDLRSGRLGRPDEIEVVWNKFLPQARYGPFDLWMLRDPTNILLELGPHSFAHLLDLVGEPESLEVEASDGQSLPGGGHFYRRWHVHGEAGGTRFSLRFSFGEGYPEHRVHVRGQLASARADFERDLYTLQRHRPLPIDFDRFAAVASEAGAAALQAAGTLGRYALTKTGLSHEGAPFQRSITRAVRSFHAGSDVDERLSPDFGVRVVLLAERVAEASGRRGAGAPVARRKPRKRAPKDQNQKAGEKVLVSGGTGFIGRALVRELGTAGYAVRVLSRGQAPPEIFGEQTVEVMRGSLSDSESVARALEGVEHVIHLARGNGQSFEDFEHSDVQPTRELAEAAEHAGVKRFVYASSIAIYDAGDPAGVILDDTPADPAVMAGQAYARAKAVCESQLLEMNRKSGFGTVIVRPGIVLGSGGNPCHWGVGMWPFHSVCVVWGAGRTPLPIVLVDDVARAMRRCIEVEEVAGEAFNLVGAPCLSAQDYLDELERAAGFRLTRRSTPIWKFFANDAFKWLVKSAVRYPGRVRPSYRAWRARSAAARFDCSKAERVLNWEPTTERERVIEEGIRVPAAEFLS